MKKVSVKVDLLSKNNLTESERCAPKIFDNDINNIIKKVFEMKDAKLLSSGIITIKIEF